MRSRYLILLVFLSGLGCETPTTLNAENDRFHLTELMEAQVLELANGKLKIDKQVVVNDEGDQFQQELDSASLRKELKVFKAFDPGSPRYRNAFDITVAGTTDNYAKKANVEQGLQWVAVKKNGNDLKVTAEFIEETSIYTVQKQMNVHFEAGKIKSYALNGYQKMILRDTTFFEMEAVVLP